MMKGLQFGAHSRWSPKEPMRKIGRASVRSFQLLDDAIWCGLNKPVDKVCQKTGIPKTAIAVGSVAAGMAMGGILSGTTNHSFPRNIPILFALEFPILHFSYKRWDRMIKASQMSNTETPVVHGGTVFMREARLLALIGGSAMGAIGMFTSGIAEALLGAVGFTIVGFGVAYYLVSGSNGMGKKAKDFVKAKTKSAIALAKSLGADAKEKLGGILAPPPAPVFAPVASLSDCSRFHD